MGPSGAWLAHLIPAARRIRCTVIGRTLSLAVGRAMTLAREDRGDFVVVHASAREGERAIAHFRSSREFGDGVDPHLDLKIGHGAAAPDDADRGDIVLAAIEHDLVDKAPQQRLTLSVRGGLRRPRFAGGVRRG